MVPLAHTDALAAKLPQLQINQGWLVDSADKSNRPVDQKAIDTVPDVTCLTLQMKITAVQLQAASEGPGGGDNAGGGAAAKGAAGKGTAKGSTKKE